jgi:hypothetical protein
MRKLLVVSCLLHYVLEMCIPLCMLVPLSLHHDSLVLFSSCNQRRFVPQSQNHTQVARLAVTIFTCLLLRLGLPIDHHLVYPEVILHRQWYWTRVVISLRIHPWLLWTSIVRLILRVQVMDRTITRPSYCITLFPGSKCRQRNFVIPLFMVLVSTVTVSIVVHLGFLRHPLRCHYMLHAPDPLALGIQITLLRAGHVWDLPSPA